MPDQPDNIVPITPNARSAAEKFGAEHDRELLTILFTDLVDSTRLQFQLGNVEAARLTELHRKIVRNELAKYDAREIEWAGDSCLAVFTKPSDAVVFALRMQAEHRRVRESESKLPTVRAGMHLGEIVVKKRTDGGKKSEDLFGLQVSEAARVMSVARGNQVFCTRAVFDNARSALKGRAIDGVGDAVWVNYGAYLLKGSEEPVELCEIGSADVAVLKAPEANDKVAPVQPGGVEAMRALIPYEESVAPERRLPRWALVLIGVALVVLGFMVNRFGPGMAGLDPVANLDDPVNSIAVLPLRNLSIQGDEDYFAESMTEAITAELAKIKALKIRGRTSAMQYKDTDLKIPAIAEALNVDALIEGSVTRDGNEVRINITLMHGTTDTQLWTDSYTETITSVLKLQSDVALAIAEAVNTEISGEERDRIATTREVDPQAYAAYVLGQYYWNIRTREGLEECVRQFELAVEIDENFAEAWSSLGFAFIELADYGYADNAESKVRGREAFERSLEIDPGLGGSYAGSVEIAGFYDLDWQRARISGERAVELTPNSAIAHTRYALYLLAVGRTTESIVHLREATKLDRDDLNSSRVAGGLLHFAGRSDEAKTLLEDLLDRHPEYLDVTSWELCLAYIDLGMISEAIEAANRFGRMQDFPSDASPTLGFVLAKAGRDEEAKAILEALPDDLSMASFGAFDAARAYVELDDLDNAFDWFDRMRRVQSIWVGMLKNLSYVRIASGRNEWRALVSDDRYWKLCDQNGLPPFPPDHPGYADEQRWMAKKAAEAALAAQPKPVRKYIIRPETRIAEEALFHRAIALSPDGKRIAYVDEGMDRERMILVRELDSFESRLLHGTEGAISPAFSADGETLLYSDHTRGKVNVVSIYGGEPRTVGEAEGYTGGELLLDGSVLWVPDFGEAIMKLAAGSDDPIVVLELDPSRDDWAFAWPQTLPNGTVLFSSSRITADGTMMRVEILDPETKVRKTIVETGSYARYVASGHLVYRDESGVFAAPFSAATGNIDGASVRLDLEPYASLKDKSQITVSDGGTLAYLPRDSGLRNLVWVSDRGEVEAVGAPRRDYQQIDLSDDGESILAVVRHGFDRYSIWNFNVARETLMQVVSPGQNLVPAWVRGSTRFSYQHYLSTEDKLSFRIVDRDTGEERELFTGASYTSAHDLHPEETHLLFGYDEENRHSTDIWSVNLSDPDQRKTHLVGGPSWQRDPKFSPTGDWFVYPSHETGKWEVYVSPFPGSGRKIQISKNGGYSPMWDPHRNKIYYRDGDKMMSVDYTLDPTFTSSAPEFLFQGEFAGDLLFPGAYDVAEDGRFIMIEKDVHEDREIRIIENGLEEVKRSDPGPKAN